MSEEITAAGTIRQGAVLLVHPEPEGSCAFEAAHHSTDRVLVFHGLAEGTVLCGFHAQPVWLPDVLVHLTTTQTICDNTTKEKT